jgi:hypothetical protein
MTHSGTGETYKVSYQDWNAKTQDWSAKTHDGKK